MFEIRLRILDVRERETDPPSFLGIVEGLRALLREAMEWSAKAPASAIAERARQAAVYEARVRALCEPDSADEDVGGISRNLLKRMP